LSRKVLALSALFIMSPGPRKPTYAAIRFHILRKLRGE
jgi:anthranilate/para-aminobenzoate synthase component II